MGQGGYINLINSTKYNWQKTHQRSCQMNTWDFNGSIPAGHAARVYVEWDQGIFHNQGDDGGEARYALQGCGREFEVQAGGRDGFHLNIAFSNLAAHGVTSGSTVGLGWNHDGSVQFVLVGEDGNFSSSVSAASWMHDNLGLLGNKTLRELCTVGSHDAGMSTIDGGTAFAGAANTLTQSHGILGQLNLGSRYFDIRPVISGGHLKTGHYSQIADMTYQVCNGQSIDSIIHDLNTFSASHPEFVILNLSHDMNTDVGNNSFRAFNQSEWDRLFSQMSGIQNLYTSSAADLTTLKLSDLIGAGHAAVVVVETSGVNLGAHANKGFFTANQYPVYNKYADTNDLDGMIKDQVTKLHAQRTSPGSNCFLLSWTLTQGTAEAIGFGASIKDLADKANPKLFERLLPECSARSYPNIIYIDNIKSADVAALAMAVNWKTSHPG
jgi:hypothetical protein